MRKYYTPRGGLPPQAGTSTDPSVFTTAYAFIPKIAMTDIVTSRLPHWSGERAWIIARPMTGFAETFAQYIVELAAGGGSQNPEPDDQAQAVIFVVDGDITLTINSEAHQMKAGGYAYIPAGATWTILNHADENATFHWIRKSYEDVEGIDRPEPFVTSDAAITPTVMPDCDNKWSTTRFVDSDDLRHDMHVNIVNFEPGGHIPFDETHVMEHGLYVLSGRAQYRLNKDWHDVEAGDFMWLRAFCPQSCIANGTQTFRYLLYKDVNRHPKLRITP